ncbi:hypothetical protein B0H15DRAFT_864063 [Mycena belliarum]|uniref:DUF6533 domain-containing protein n=1 Tax=Mycena belliarum TaxID=1033014 RepID=A0AAD6TR07_9AGAR|nr:hypothetical protein B0H15DRAFT_864063 [Mycena belliae]
MTIPSLVASFDVNAIIASESLPSARPRLLYFYFCAIAILYYDHLLTFPAEVAYIWRRPKSRSAYWFFLNRYLNFFSTLPVTVFNFVRFDHAVCTKYAFFRQVLLVVQVVVVDLILSLRVYALYGLDRRILYMFACATVIGMGITGWAISAQHNPRDLEDYSVPGCFLPLSVSSGTDLAAVWEALLAYDLLIFGTILFRTSQFWLRHRGSLSSPALMTLMQRDGALYFIAMTLANLSNIITFYLGGSFTKGGLSTFATTISVTMTSRLMLNLHALADRGLYSEAAFHSRVSDRADETLDTIFPSYSAAGPAIELRRTEASAPLNM